MWQWFDPAPRCSGSSAAAATGRAVLACRDLVCGRGVRSRGAGCGHTVRGLQHLSCARHATPTARLTSSACLGIVGQLACPFQRGATRHAPPHLALYSHAHRHVPTAPPHPAVLSLALCSPNPGATLCRKTPPPPPPPMPHPPPLPLEKQVPTFLDPALSHSRRRLNSLAIADVF